MHHRPSSLAEQLRKRLGPCSTVVAEGDAAYDEAREQFATHQGAAADADRAVAPSVVVRPGTEADLSTVIRFACERDLRLVPRSGGHQYSGLSSIPRDAGPSIQLDMGHFGDVVLPPGVAANRRPPGRPDVQTWRVVLGAGARLRNVYRIMAEHHLVFPGGVCVDVGVGGHLQSSSMGILGRSFGLGLDLVRRVRIALAETGAIIDATAESHPELFWALLGGSPGAFGVVLEFEVEVFNARCFSHAYGIRTTWDYTDALFHEQLEVLRGITELPAYRQRRDATIYVSVNRSLLHPYLAAGADAPRAQHITLMVAWTGIDSGSIHAPMPEDLRGAHPAGATFHDAIIQAFLDTAPPTEESISYELDQEKDPDEDLSMVAARLVAPNIVGRLDDNWREIAPLLVGSAEEELRRTREVRAAAEDAGVDWSAEVARYDTAARFSFEPLPASFADVCVAQLQRMREIPDLGCVFQMLPMGGQLLEDTGGTAFPQRAVRWGFDLWALWRGSLGDDLAEAASAWVAETDAALRAVMGARTARLLYCTCGELDIHDDEIRRLYYPDDDHFDRLCRVKHRYDPQDRFRSRFTVPPLPGKTPVAPPVAETLAPTTGLRIPAAHRFRSILMLALETIGADPDKPFLTWIEDDGRFRPPVRFGEFGEEMLAYAAWLRDKLGVGPGDRIVVCMPPGPEFFYAVMACQTLGAIPVAAYLFDPSRDHTHRRAFLHIVEDCRPRAILTSRLFDLRRRVALRARPLFSRLPWAVLRRGRGRGRRVVPVQAGRDDVALIQYTSGTTGPSKGVVLTQANLLRQLALVDGAIEPDEDSRALGWMPQAHDFGLISTMITALVTGSPCAMMSPLAFVKRPDLWFDAVHRFRATHTAGPNFSFALALAKTTPEQRARWDLSCLKVLMSAAEPIDPDTMEAFFEAFAPAGLSRSAFVPAYGLVEHTVGATMGGGHVLHFDPDALAQGRAQPMEGGVALWSSGRVHEHLELEIVEDGEALPEGRVGEIWLDGPCRSPGWLGPDGRVHAEWGRLADGEARWIRSGDVGFVWGDQLFVLCRLPDLVRIDGHHLYPPLVERDLARLPWARPGGLVAHPTADGRLGVVVELDRRRVDAVDPDRLLGDLEAVLDAYAPWLAEVAVVEKGFVPKTTSGKRRRLATAERLERGEADAQWVARR